MLATAALVACEGDGGGDGEGGGIEISGARAHFTTTDLGAVYLDIRSTGAADVLIAASTEIADDVQLHENVTEGSASVMRAITGGIPVEAGGHVRLAPGGYHVMLLGVAEIPAEGDHFALVLEFERAGRMTVTVHVEPFGEQGEHTHDDHDHDTGAGAGHE